MIKKLTLLIAVIAVTALMAVPAMAQEDRSSDTGYGFAGRAEYNQPATGANAGSPDELPDTGGSSLIFPIAGGALLAGGVLLTRRIVR